MSEQCERTDERVAQYFSLGFLVDLAHSVVSFRITDIALVSSRTQSVPNAATAAIPLVILFLDAPSVGPSIGLYVPCYFRR